MSKIKRPLLSRDTRATIDACKLFGADILEEDVLVVKGRLPLIVPDNVVNVENSGTTLRLMTSVSALAPKGYSVLTGDASIRTRPMLPLLKALNSIGVRCWSTRSNGCAPIIVEGGGVSGGSVSISGEVSSQFISSLLIATPLANRKTLVRIEGKSVSRPYLDATMKMVEYFGGEIVEEPNGVFNVSPNQQYSPKTFSVPGDFSSGSTILLAGAVAGGEVSVEGFDFSLPHGDMVIVDILKNMGVKVIVDKMRGKVTVNGSSSINGGEFNLVNTPDLLPVVALLACKSEKKVVITGVKHARFKETDRVSVLAQELPKLGVQIKEFDDGLEIVGSRHFKNCTLDAHDDHRMAMVFSIAGLASKEGCWVDGFESIDVSYPGFADDIHKLGGNLQVVAD